jgi:hypothetical protein
MTIKQVIKLLRTLNRNFNVSIREVSIKYKYYEPPEWKEGRLFLKEPEDIE